MKGKIVELNLRGSYLKLTFLDLVEAKWIHLWDSGSTWSLLAMDGTLEMAQ